MIITSISQRKTQTKSKSCRQKLAFAAVKHEFWSPIQEEINRNIVQFVIQSRRRYDSKSSITAAVGQCQGPSPPYIPLQSLCLLYRLVILVHQLQHGQSGSKL